MADLSSFPRPFSTTQRIASPRQAAQPVTPWQHDDWSSRGAHHAHERHHLLRIHAPHVAPKQGIAMRCLGRERLAEEQRRRL